MKSMKAVVAPKKESNIITVPPATPRLRSARATMVFKNKKAYNRRQGKSID